MSQSTSLRRIALSWAPVASFGTTRGASWSGLVLRAADGSELLEAGLPEAPVAPPAATCGTVRCWCRGPRIATASALGAGCHVVALDPDSEPHTDPLRLAVCTTPPAMPHPGPPGRVVELLRGNP